MAARFTSIGDRDERPSRWRKFYGSRLGFVLARIEAYSIEAYSLGSGEAEIATGIFRNRSDSVARRLLFVWTYFSGVLFFKDFQRLLPIGGRRRVLRAV